MSQDESSSIIGYLTPTKRAQVVICLDCAETLERSGYRGVCAVPVYRVNLAPYRQTCRLCHAVIHAGARGWPELFDGTLLPLSRNEARNNKERVP